MNTSKESLQMASKLAKIEIFQSQIPLLCTPWDQKLFLLAENMLLKLENHLDLDLDDIWEK